MKLTKNFFLSEFNCKDGTPVPEILVNNVIDLATELQILRNATKSKITINSGYRTKEYNKKVGGRKNSFHLKAMAGDISVENYSPREIFKIIEALINLNIMKQGGLFLYPTFVHYDIRGVKAR